MLSTSRLLNGLIKLIRFKKIAFVDVLDSDRHHQHPIDATLGHVVLHTSRTAARVEKETTPMVRIVERIPIYGRRRCGVVIRLKIRTIRSLFNGFSTRAFNQISVNHVQSVKKSPYHNSAHRRSIIRFIHPLIHSFI